MGVRWDGKDRGWFCWPNPRLERTAPSALPLKRKPLGGIIMNRIIKDIPEVFNINDIENGYIYNMRRGIQFKQTGLFLKIAFVGNVFIKIPSKRGWNDYHKYVKCAIPDPEDIRALESKERIENMEETIKTFPDLRNLLKWNISKDIIHWLLIYRLQYERCRSWIPVPLTKFVVLRFRRFGLLSFFKPALVQEKVTGTRLWDMIDFLTEKVSDRWKSNLPSISRQLSPLLSREKIKHINWNIQNFIFNEEQDKLWYVDLTPTLFISRWGNEHNLKGIREEFIM